MKKLKIVLFSVFAMGLTLTSCSDDDSSGGNASIEGKWEYFKEGMSANGQEVLTDWEHTEGCNKDYIEINDDGTYTDVYYYGENCETDTETGTWERDGNNITVDFDGETMTGKIAKLTSSELRIEVEEDMGGQTVDYVTVFKRAD